jgi:TolA-binding protein
MKSKLTVLAWLALGAAIAVPATAWFIGSGTREARQLQFKPEGTDLQATDVEAAIRELSQKVRQVEGTQSALQGAARVQQSQLGEVKAQATEKDGQNQQRMTSLESRMADVAAPRRRIEYTDSSDTSSVNARYAPLRDLGSFSKTSATSTVLLSWNTHVDAMGEPGTFCDFQIRVDGRPDTEREGGGGRAVVYVPPTSTGGSSPVTVSTLFGRVGSGHHTASIWVRGTARECMENYGNFPRSVIVEEGPRLEP